MATPQQIASDLFQWRQRLMGHHLQGIMLDTLSASLNRAEKTIRKLVEDVENRDRIISMLEDEKTHLKSVIGDLEAAAEEEYQRWERSEVGHYD